MIGPKVERAGKWESINFPIAMSNVGLVPLREIGVSFGAKHGDDGGDRVAGDIENKSERVFACIRVTFQLTRESMPAGTLDFDVKDLQPRETRPYEKVVPSGAGYYLLSKSEC